jgi:hypothetical protein
MSSPAGEYFDVFHYRILIMTKGSEFRVHRSRLKNLLQSCSFPNLRAFEPSYETAPKWHGFSDD